MIPLHAAHEKAGPVRLPWIDRPTKRPRLDRQTEPYRIGRPQPRAATLFYALTLKFMCWLFPPTSGKSYPPMVNSPVKGMESWLPSPLRIQTSVSTWSAFM